MTAPSRSLAWILAVYSVWVCLLTLGSSCFRGNEALGGMILGLTGTVVGILLPYHLWNVGLLPFRFSPAQGSTGRVACLSVLFAALYLGLYPAGFLGSRTTMRFFESPPSIEAGLATFAFLMSSAFSYALLFWGGLLSATARVSGRPAAVLVTGLLFSVYHLSQFPFVPLTLSFFAEMFVCAALLAAFTLAAGCVLPALIVAQIEQFFYFAARDDNPFAEPVQALSVVVLVLLLLGGYTWAYRRWGSRAAVPAS